MIHMCHSHDGSGLCVLYSLQAHTEGAPVHAVHWQLKEEEGASSYWQDTCLLEEGQHCSEYGTLCSRTISSWLR